MGGSALSNTSPHHPGVPRAWRLARVTAMSMVKLFTALEGQIVGLYL